MERPEMKLNTKLIRKWVKALESGDYNQVEGQLCKYDPKADEDSFCCLGVLCVVEGFEAVERDPDPWRVFPDSDTKNWPRDVDFVHPKYKTDAALQKAGRREGYGLPTFSKSGLTEEQADALVKLNDEEKASFADIAKYIRANILGE
jgi:hypothetical protein